MTAAPSLCAWGCGAPALPRGRFCSKRCRQAAFRLRSHSAVLLERKAAYERPTPMVFAYADPPYPGTAARWYGREDSYAGEVDHRALVSSLVEASGDRAIAHLQTDLARRIRAWTDGRSLSGWALSTSARALRDVLPLCPVEARVCAWVKPHEVPPASRGLHNVWEVLIVSGGRREAPGKPDGLVALPARGEGELPGRKPRRFITWLFAALGMRPEVDTLIDLFPGTGIVGRSWEELRRAAAHGDGSAKDLFRPPTSAVRGDDGDLEQGGAP